MTSNQRGDDLHGITFWESEHREPERRIPELREAERQEDERQEGGRPRVRLQSTERREDERPRVRLRSTERREDQRHRAERHARGDGFVNCACGSKHWGLLGAAGILAWRPGSAQERAESPNYQLAAEPEVLLQLRVSWSHEGGTWAVPGGAINRGETAWEGAIREFSEEAGFSEFREPSGSHVLEHPDWSYTTFVAQVADPNVEPVANRESEDLRWVPVSRVEDLELMAPFRAALPDLLALIRP